MFYVEDKGPVKALRGVGSVKYRFLAFLPEAECLYLLGLFLSYEEWGLGRTRSILSTFFRMLSQVV